MRDMFYSEKDWLMFNLLYFLDNLPRSLNPIISNNKYLFLHKIQAAQLNTSV